MPSGCREELQISGSDMHVPSGSGYVGGACGSEGDDQGDDGLGSRSQSSRGPAADHISASRFFRAYSGSSKDQ